ncbi:SpoIIE family protein phosphatase [Streptomyces tubercidicus]|uniref:SpoIIE family protein phosphatase n=1 Tax=Streptomyces tubercidicus TaxID=47759 RepID=UPI002E11F852|nr:SpoIIE family protein phosphatase [Streptomyces tubercidicus]
MHPGTPEEAHGPADATVRLLAPAELAHAGAAAVDERGMVIGWTHTAEQLLGYPEAEVLARPATALLADPAALEGCLRAQKGWSGVVTARHRSGRQLELGVWAWPLQRAGQERGWFVVGYDIGDTPWWEVNRAVLERLMEHSPVGIAVFDTELRYLWANAELERLGGVSRAQRLGRTFAEVQPLMDREPIESLMRQVLETGEPVRDCEFRGRTQANPHQEHVGAASIFRVYDTVGQVQGVCSMVVDATDRFRSRERLALLSEAGERIGTTLDVMRTAQELADFAVPRLADVVTVDLFEPVLRGEEPPDTSPHLPPLRRAGQRSVLPGCPELLTAIGEEAVYAPGSPISRCLLDGTAHLEPLLDPSTVAWMRADQARTAKIREWGLHSYMAVPIRARETTLGAVGFLRSERSDPFEEEDLQLVGEAVARGAICIDNARRYTRERTGALALQRSLLPHPPAVGVDLDVAARYFPAGSRSGVGGDWFDVIPLSGARVALVVGDVVGHGVHAAAAMGRLRTAVRALADMDLPPDELLAHLDDVAIRFIEEEPVDHAAVIPFLGSSCLVMVLDRVTRRCTMARAGHPPPAIVEPNGTVYFPDLPDGPPLGLGHLPFETGEVDVPEGSLLVLYTDGLIEGFDRDVDVGLGRLRAALSCPGRSPEEVCGAVVDVLTTEQPRDDVALLVARARALAASRVVTFDLALDPVEVAAARAGTARALTGWNLDELAFTTELIVSELVTNAIRYASGPIQLRLIRHSVLICEVSDTSSTSPRLRHARTSDEGGRGLFLVAQLSKRWGTRYTPAGKVIWAEQALGDT